MKNPDEVSTNREDNECVSKCLLENTNCSNDSASTSAFSFDSTINSTKVKEDSNSEGTKVLPLISLMSNCMHDNGVYEGTVISEKTKNKVENKNGLIGKNLQNLKLISGLKSQNLKYKNSAALNFLQTPKKSDVKDYNLCCSCGIMNRFFGTKIRYLILLITVLCMAATRSNELAFNFTVICMTANTSDPPLPMKPGEISAIFAAGGAGAIIMVLPIVYLLHYLGPRLVFSSLLGLSSIATVCLPSLARVSPLWMVVARLLQGLCLSSVLPLMGWISAQWAAQVEIGKFMTFLSSSSQLSQILTMPLSAHLCVTSGWSSVFYAHSLISAILATLFFLFYRNSPKNHPCIKHDELKYITSGVRPIKKEPVPHKEIIQSKAVWGIWIAFLGNSFGFQLIVQFMPTFLNKVLGVPISRTGIAAIIPPMAQLVVKILAGWLSDRITFISEIRKLQLFNSLAMVGCGLFLLPLGYLSNDKVISSTSGTTQLLALLCFTSSISCLGMVASGSMKSATLVARNFTHFIMAVVQLLVCIGMLLVPILVSWLAPNNEIHEWRRVFFVVFWILFCTNLIFCRFCSAEGASWAVNNKVVLKTTVNNPLLVKEDIDISDQAAKKIIV